MEWQNILYSALGMIITGLVSWGVERLIAFLNTKIKNIKALTYLTDAISIVTNSVKSTYQTYVQSLKDKDVFTEEAQKTALIKALNQAQSQMSEELKKYITNNFGNLTDWITTQIEASLYNLKNYYKEKNI